MKRKFHPPKSNFQLEDNSNMKTSKHNTSRTKNKIRREAKGKSPPPSSSLPYCGGGGGIIAVVVVLVVAGAPMAMVLHGTCAGSFNSGGAGAVAREATSSWSAAFEVRTCPLFAGSESDLCKASGTPSAGAAVFAYSTDCVREIIAAPMEADSSSNADSASNSRTRLPPSLLPGATWCLSTS
ncbi:hypothetical protein BDZ97DRAFT_296545 [Flammula alnicola]|nr:hypothetical protein BDZ97DRAFT_296545 [Flammula alnicola]